MTKKIFFFLVTGLLVSFVTTQAQWIQTGADIDAEAEGDQLGRHSVSLSNDGSVVAIGAPENNGNGISSGHVRVYQNNSGTWEQIGEDIDGEDTYSHLGHSVSLCADGSVIAIGAPENGGTGYFAGHVRVYQNNSGTWEQIGEDIDAEAEGDQSGWSVSLSSAGSVLAIGAVSNDGNGVSSGHVRVYENNIDSWEQIGQDIDGKDTEDNFGHSVSLCADGSVVAIGAIENDFTGTTKGYVSVYQNNSGTWEQIGEDIAGEVVDDWCGYSVSLSADGSVLAIGAKFNDGNGDMSGHVRVYKNNSGTWEQIGDDINGEAAGDLSGGSVSLSADGTVLAIGAVGNDGNGSCSGHVRVFKNNENSWDQITADIDGEASGDNSGCALNLNADGSVLAIGAWRNSGNGTDAGHVRVYNCPLPIITTQPQSQENVTPCTDIIFSVVAEGSDLTYQWRKDEINLTDGGNISGAFTNELTIISVSNEDAGTYVCIVTGNCGDVTSDDAVLSILTGINNLSENSISIYPNPTNGTVNINFAKVQNISKVELTDIAGRKIIEKTIIQQNETIDLSDFESGIYIISIQTDKEIFKTKIVKR